MRIFYMKYLSNFHLTGDVAATPKKLEKSEINPTP